MCTREEANRLITFVFYETNTKADWGSLGTVCTLRSDMMRYLHWRWNGTAQGGGGAPPTFDLILSMQRS